jgi:ubiquinone/menaquinone biosynthesis C-methylase UbiE
MIPEKRFLEPQKVVHALAIEEGMYVADLGCGTGHLAQALAEQVGEEGIVFAVDRDDEQVSAVRGMTRGSGYRNVRCIRADIIVDNVPELEQNPCDVIFVSNLFYVITQRQQAISKIIRFIKPDGRVAVIEWDATPSLFGPPPSKRVARDSLINMFSDAGFVVGQDFDAGMYHYGVIFSSRVKEIDQETAAKQKKTHEHKN